MRGAAPAHPALGVEHDGLVPFPDVAALVERAVITACVGKAAHGDKIVAAVVLFAVVSPETRRVLIGGARLFGCGRFVAAGRIPPIPPRRAAFGFRLVIGRLIPFVLRGNPNPCPGLMHGEPFCTRNVVGPGFRVAAAHAVVEPVGKPHGIKKTDLAGRLRAELGSHHVMVSAGFALPIDEDPLPLHTRRGGVFEGGRPQAVGITRRDGVEKLRVLAEGDLGFCDLKSVGDPAVTCAVRRITRVRNRHPLQVQRRSDSRHQAQTQGKQGSDVPVTGAREVSRGGEWGHRVEPNPGTADLLENPCDSRPATVRERVSRPNQNGLKRWRLSPVLPRRGRPTRRVFFAFVWVSPAYSRQKRRIPGSFPGPPWENPFRSRVRAGCWSRRRSCRLRRRAG